MHYQGWNNFLWFSDIAFLATCLALWLESRLLASMTAVGILLPDLAWTLHFLADLIVDTGLLEQSGYMFNEQIPLFVRGLSLFHAVVPPLLVWMVYRLGYDGRGLAAQTLLAWLVLPACYFFTDPAESINFVSGFGEPPRPPIPQPWWLIAESILLPVGIYLPTHLLLARWFGRPACRVAGADGNETPVK
ncbi:membrane-associated protein [Alienimonas californiensis]|uniref:membrane-associated protein n=1 Tax=Alienimonas californiensis TaxID=2527989 RepID=UPI0011A12E4D|nr:membrane-associated protein [Alienimonas californiensis]